MEHKIKIAILGGTGKAGKYIVNQLVREGYSLKLLHRHPENLEPGTSPIEVVKGDARDYHAVLSTVQGCQAVISAIGQPKGEPSIFSQATHNVIRAMNVCGVDRYISLTGLNVDAGGDNKSTKTKYATDWMREHYPITTADKQVELTVLTESTVNWTLVRLPLIELSDLRHKLEVSLEDCPGDKISATDLAWFVFGQLNDTQYARKAPFIANG